MGTVYCRPLCVICGGPQGEDDSQRQRQLCAVCDTRLFARETIVADRRCTWCGASFGRRRYPSGQLEPVRAFRRRRYCSPACKEAAGGAPMSTTKDATKTCAGCGASFGRWRYPWGTFERAASFRLRRYCSSACARADRRMPAVDASASTDRMGWTARAACRQSDPELFFPEPPTDSSEPAKRICGCCDVREQCLRYALAHDPLLGIWGGLDEDERGRLARDRASLGRRVA